jgi:acyl-CoA synthetase (AMP-forming)/AMP-acid ligase II
VLVARSQTVGVRSGTCVVPTPGRTLTTEQVIGLFEDRLAAYKHPREVISLDTLPRNWHGKVDRRRLHDIVTTAAPQHRVNA